MLSWSQVSSGSNYNLAIRSDGTLWGWGLNTSGEFGLNDTVYRSSPVQIGTNSWIAVSAGLGYSAGIRSDYTLWTWGVNSQGQLGNNSTVNRSSPVQVFATYWYQVGGGESHTVAIKSDGSLWAWGNNTYGQLGDGTTINRSSPVQIGGRKDYIFVSKGTHNWGTFVLTQGITISGGVKAGEQWAWGRNSGPVYGGILGDNTTIDRSSPVQIATALSAVQIAAGMLITNTGTLWTWGPNGRGQVGDGTTVSRSSPVQVGALTNWASVFNNTMITASGSNKAAIKTDGTAWVWGANDSGQLGDNTTIDKSSPVQVGVPLEIASLIIRGTGTFGWATDGFVFTWGFGSSGEIGLGDLTSRSSPVQLASQQAYTDIASGQINTHVIKNDGTLWGWGSNSQGGVGDNTTVLKSSPVPIGNENNWLKVFNGNPRAAITNDYRLYVWGYNVNGQVGDGTTVTRSSPVQIPGSWLFVAGAVVNNEAVSNAIAGIRTDGTLWTWGGNASGQLGQGDTVDRSSPVQVKSGTLFKYVSVGLSHTIALDTSNNMWAMGLNTFGQLGDTTTVSRSSPVQIGSPNTWSRISLGTSHSMAIRSDGGLYTWGGNATVGPLGLGDTLNRSSPSQVGTKTTWQGIVAGNVTSFAYEVGGSLTTNSYRNWYAWGQNGSANYGDFTTVSRSSPVQLSATFSPLSFSAATFFSTKTLGLLSTTGKVFASGDSTNYIGGRGDFVNRSAAVQIPTFNSTDIKISTIGGATRDEGVSTWTGYALSSSGDLYGWGYNTDRPVYTVNSNTVSVPTLINSAPSSARPYNDSYFNMAFFVTDSQTRTYTWGRNNVGQLGNNTTVSRSSPVQLSTGNSQSWVSVSAGRTFATAVTSDGKLFAWGGGSSYVLGQGDTFNRSSPVQIPSTLSFTKVAADVSGLGWALAIDSDNKLYGWGYNSDGQLGNQSLSSYSFLNTLNGMTNGCGFIANNGSNTNALYMWGFNAPTASGTVGDGTTQSRSSPVQIPGSWSIVSQQPDMGGNDQMTLAIKTDGTLWAWGLNTNGTLGDGTVISRSSPVQIGFSSWISVAAGGRQSAAITTDGKLFTWGFGADGVLGDGTTVSRSSPVQIPGTNSWKQVYSGPRAVYAIRQDNTLWSWGFNSNGELGDGTTVSKSSPVQVGTASNWSSLAVYTSWAIGIDSTSKVYGWGWNFYGQLGQGDTIARSTPVQIMSTSSFSMIGAGILTTYLLDIDGRLLAVGYGGHGGFADLTVTSRSSPVQLTTGTYYSAIKINGGTIWALDVNNKLWTWGNNVYGQSGLNDTVYRSSPVQISAIARYIPAPVKIGDSSWSQISAGASFSMALRSDGTLFAWGNNTYGQAGQQPLSVLSGGISGFSFLRNDGIYLTAGLNTSSGQFGNGSTTVPSTSLNLGYSGQNNSLRFRTTTFTRINSFNIDINYKLQTAGLNTSGQLGDGTTINRSFPTQIGNSSWLVVNASSLGPVTLAIKADGTLWAWGNNTYGQYGSSSYGQNASNSSPVQVGTSSWSNISVGDQFVLALKADSTLWAWGSNVFGQLGQNYTYTNVSWSQLATYSGSSYGIRSDGKLFAWGNNNVGQVGDGTTVSRSLPVQITSSSFSQISANGSFAVGLTTAGNLLTWGFNGSGQLGTGDVVNRSQPVQVGDWSVTSAYTDVSMNYGAVVLKRGNNTYGFGQYWPSLAAAPAGWRYGFGDTISRSVPTLISSDYVQATIANSTFLAIGTNGVLTATGNYPGNGSTFTSSPVQISAFGTGVSWSTLIKHNAAQGTIPVNGAIDSLGKLYLWGQTSTGIFNGPFVASENLTAPREWKPGTSFTVVTTNGSLLFAVTNTGVLWAIGQNNLGQLGDGTTVAKSSPVQIAATAGATWSNVSVAYSDTVVALNSLGQVYCWGSNAFGAVGDNTTVNKSSPVQVGVGTSFTAVYAGNGSIYAKTTTGTVFSWGLNTSGELGTNDTSNGNRSSPVQIGTSSWTMIAAGTWGAGGILNGNYYAWGQLPLVAPLGSSGISIPNAANNSFLGIRSPVQITSYNSTSYSWSNVAAGESHIVAIRTDGTIWSWGANDYYQLTGNLLTPVVPSPVPLVGGGSYVSVGAGSKHSLAIDTLGRLYGWGKTDKLELGSTNNYVSWISVGARNAVRSDGTAWVWGPQTNGELGNGFTSENRSTPIQLGSDTNWKQIEIGGSGSTSHGLKTDGTIWGWGLNTNGAVGDLTTINRSSPVQVAGTAGLSFVSFTTDYTGDSILALTNDNRLYAWGNNTGGALGLNDVANRSSPVQIPGSWTSINIKGFNTFGIRSNSTLWIWGQNSAFGPLGANDTVARSSPVQLGTSSWSMVMCAGHTTAGITIDGKLFTWGAGANGALGDNQLVNRSSPVQVGNSSWTQVWAYGYWVNLTGPGNALFHAFLYDPNYNYASTLFTWGYGINGLLGDNTIANRSSPVQTGAFLRASPVSVNTFQTGWTPGPTSYKNFCLMAEGSAVAVDNFGHLWRWGINTSGQLGDNTTVTKSSAVGLGAGAVDTNAIYLLTSNANGYYPIVYTRRSPVQLAVGSSFTLVAAGGFTSAAIKTDGTLWTWGDNISYSAGQPYVSKIIGSQLTTYVLKNNGELTATGYNVGGELGIGTISPNFSNLNIISAGFNNYWLDVSTGYNTSTQPNWILGLRSDYKLFAWGNNTIGGLGTGDTAQRSAPVQIGNSSWIAIAAAAENGFAIKPDYTLWVWGKNAYGELGQNDAVARSSPVQLAGSWATVWTSSSHVVAKKTDGTIWGWGLNSSGQLGDNTTVSRSSPVQITSITNLQQISIGQIHTVYVNTLGQLFATGGNSTGQLGDTTTVNKSTFTSVANGKSWQQVGTGLGHTLALATDNTVWAWGFNSQGQLGDGTTVNKSSPIQVTSGSGIYQIVATYYGSYYIPISYTAANPGAAMRVLGLGFNTSGQLGDGSTVSRSSPVAIMTADQTATGMTLANYFNSCAIPIPKQIAGSWTQVSIQKQDNNATAPNNFPYIGGGFGVKTNGTLWAWGTNSYGVLGTGDTLARISITQIGSATNWSKSETSIYNSLLLNTTGFLYGQGQNAAGGVGQNDTVARSSPVQIFSGYYVLDPVQIPGSWSAVKAADAGAITATSDFALGLKSDGTLYAWGKNNVGQLGQNDTISRSSPVQLFATNNSGFNSLIFNSTNYLTLPSNQNILFGNDNFTIEGWVYIPSGGFQGFVSKRADSTTVFNGINIDVTTTPTPGVRVLISITNSSWIDSNVYGTLSVNTWTHIALVRQGSTVTTYINGSSVATQTISGTIVENTANLTIGARAADGTGLLVSGSLVSNVRIVKGVAVYTGNFTVPTSPLQTSQSSGTNINAVTASQTSLLTAQDVLIKDNSVNSYLLTNVNTVQTLSRTPFSSPTSTNSSFVSIGAGMSSAAAITIDNKLFTWGANPFGQLADGTTVNKSSPVQVLGQSYKQVIIGDQLIVSAFSDYGDKREDLLFGAGNGASGYLADGTSTSRSVPTQITSVYDPIGTLQGSWTNLSTSSPVQVNSVSHSLISAGSAFSLAVNTQGTLYAWGFNASGTLGDGTTINRFYPAIRNTLSTVLISAGYSHTTFVVSNDPVTGYKFLSTGLNTGGQIGDNTTVSRSNPTQVSFAASINTSSPVQISTYDFSSIYFSSPIQIGTSSWAAVSVGENFALATTSSGLLFAWGYNALGQVGDNTTINRSSPVQLSSLNSWTQISAGYSHSIVKNSNNNAYTFGSNNKGQLGDNT